MRQRLLAGAILLLTFLVFLPAIHYELVYDDIEQLVNNPRLTAWSYVPGYFTNQLWANIPGQVPFYYRPVFLLWFRLLYATMGGPGELWHLASIVAHLVATACVFVFLRRLTGEFKGAALAAALFAVHPIHTEVVAWVSASGDLLLTIFLVLSVYFYARRKGAISLPSILFALLAMFTKEVGIVAPVLLFAYEWIESRFKNALVSTLPYAVAALLYIAFRVNAVRSLMIAEDPAMSVGAMVLTWPRVLATYAYHLVWPVHLSPCYDVPVVTAMWPLLLLLVLIASLLWLLRGSCANVRFGAAWFAITLAPALAIRYITWHDYVHDRYLYLPSVGIALIAAVWLGRIRFSVPRALACCAVVLVLGLGTRLDLPIWHDNIALFRRALETAPGNPAVKTSLAEAYLTAHREAEAFPLLQQIIQQYPRKAVANYNMGLYYQQIGNPQAAEYYFSISDQLSGN